MAAFTPRVSSATASQNYPQPLPVDELRTKATAVAAGHLSPRVSTRTSIVPSFITPEETIDIMEQVFLILQKKFRWDQDEMKKQSIKSLELSLQEN